MFHNYTLPVVRANTAGTQTISYVNVPLGAWDTLLGDGGLALGMILSYLSEVWLKVITPQQSPTDTDWIPAVGEGQYSFADYFSGFQISLALFEVEGIPQDIDCFFGDNPILYLGQCAFTKQAPLLAVSSQTGMFEVRATNKLPRFPLKYINYPECVFIPDYVNATGFWWHLKPGVTGRFRFFGTELMSGVKIDCPESFIDPEIPICAVNPRFWVRDERYPPGGLSGPPDGPGG